MSENEEIIDLSFTQNRELSWLRFNDRVLSEAANKEVPLMERFRFISIFTSNLDEFFMVRVGSLFDLAAIAPKHIDSKSGFTPEEQLENIFFSVDPLYKKRDALFTNVMKELSNRGVIELSYNDLTDEERDYVLNYSREYIKPLFSPQIVDATHPFPEIVNKLTYIAASMKDKNKNKRVGLIEIPESAPQIIMLPGDECRYIRTEEFIKAIINLVFPSYEILETIVFRVTRNADITLDEEKFDDDNIDMISQVMIEDAMQIEITLDEKYQKNLNEAIMCLKKEVKQLEIATNRKYFKIAVGGKLIEVTPGAAAKVFTILGENNIHFYQVTTSKRTISFIVDKKDKDLAMKKLDETFGLNI